MDRPERITTVKSLLSPGEDRVFPYTFEAFGIEFEVHENVFESHDLKSWHWFTENLPSFAGARVLEIGCGMGVTSIFLAMNGAKEVAAVDINPDAVRNARANAERIGVKNIRIFESDIFSAVDKGSKFDLIYWSIPSTEVPEDYEFESMMERSTFDPGRRLLDAFLTQGPHYLEPGGVMLLGIGDIGDCDIIPELVRQKGLSIALLAERKRGAQELVTLKLYAIAPDRR